MFISFAWIIAKGMSYAKEHPTSDSARRGMLSFASSTSTADRLQFSGTKSKPSWCCIISEWPDGSAPDITSFMTLAGVGHGACAGPASWSGCPGGLYPATRLSFLPAQNYPPGRRQWYSCSLPSSNLLHSELLFSPLMGILLFHKFSRL